MTADTNIENGFSDFLTSRKPPYRLDTEREFFEAGARWQAAQPAQSPKGSNSTGLEMEQPVQVNEEEIAQVIRCVNLGDATHAHESIAGGMAIAKAVIAAINNKETTP